MDEHNSSHKIPRHWTQITINDAIHIIDYRGRTPPYRDSGIPHLRSSNVKNGNIIWEGLRYVSEDDYQRYMTRGLPEPGDLLFTTEAPLGEVALAPDCRFSLAQRMMILRAPKSFLQPKFLLYQIMTEAFQGFLTGKGTGTTVTGVSSRNFKTVSIFIAPSSEQCRIVAKIEELFTKLDAGVASLKAAKKQLKRYRQSVLKAAVEGELTREWREKHKEELEPASVLLERILKERRAKWEADQLAKMQDQGKPPKDDKWKAKYQEPAKPDVIALPALPSGWMWFSTEQLAEVGTGATPLRSKNAYYSGGIIAWVTSGALNNLFVDKAEEYITPLALEETNAKVFPKGSLLVAMYGEGKTRGKVSELRIEAATNQACAALVFQDQAIATQRYAKIFYQKNYDDIRRLSSGGVQPNLNLSIIKNTPLPLPPLAEQEQIVAEVERRLSVTDEIEATLDAELKRAERLRQSILKRAFEGRLVPQDPNDEPASVLLERIKVERSEFRLQAVSQARKGKGKKPA